MGLNLLKKQVGPNEITNKRYNNEPVDWCILGRIICQSFRDGLGALWQVTTFNL